jgi:hypothetical protein
MNGQPASWDRSLTPDAFQVSPEQWEVEVKQRLLERGRQTQPKLPRTLAEVMSATSVPLHQTMKAIAEEAADEGSEMTHRVHHLLDGVGF